MLYNKLRIFKQFREIIVNKVGFHKYYRWIHSTNNFQCKFWLARNQQQINDDCRNYFLRFNEFYEHCRYELNSKFRR
jgi:hypothetical protein